jgi:hypothetical protein
MSQTGAAIVGNDFILPKTKIADKPTSVPPLREEAFPTILPIEVPLGFKPYEFEVSQKINHKSETSAFEKTLGRLHRHSFITFTLLFFLVAASGIEVAGQYYEAHLMDASLTTTRPLQHTIAGLNLTLPQSQLQSKIQTITAQPATLSVGSQTLTLSPSDIKSWLKITANNSESTIHIKPASIDNSLVQLAQQFVKAPVNQVSVTHTDGITPSGVIVAGNNGTKLSDPSTLQQQSSLVAKNLLSGKSSLNFTTPLKNVPFQAVSPAAFPKLLEVDLTTKRMYAYQNGQLVNTFPVSAGKPSTPTPIGEFHIWDKLASQTMTGPGYVQPNVPWVNYFDHSGNAVHGVYWRAASVFGNINTSHGCVGVPVSAGEWIYDWAPIGTTVITYS